MEGEEPLLARAEERVKLVRSSCEILEIVRFIGHGMGGTDLEEIEGSKGFIVLGGTT